MKFNLKILSLPLLINKILFIISLLGYLYFLSTPNFNFSEGFLGLTAFFASMNVVFMLATKVVANNITANRWLVATVLNILFCVLSSFLFMFFEPVQRVGIVYVLSNPFRNFGQLAGFTLLYSCYLLVLTAFWFIPLMAFYIKKITYLSLIPEE